MTTPTATGPTTTPGSGGTRARRGGAAPARPTVRWAPGRAGTAPHGCPRPTPPDEEGRATRAEKPLSNRSPWRLAAWLTVVAVILAAVAVGGWWLGSGRYGEIPQVIGLDRSSAVAQVEEAGFSAVTREV